MARDRATRLSKEHRPVEVLEDIARHQTMVLSERDRRFEEASLNLGASQVETFFRVTIPMSMPAIVAVLNTPRGRVRLNSRVA